MKFEKRQKAKLPRVSLKQRFLNHGSAKGNYKVSLTERVNYNAAVSILSSVANSQPWLGITGLLHGWCCKDFVT